MSFPAVSGLAPVKIDVVILNKSNCCIGLVNSEFLNGCSKLCRKRWPDEVHKC